jgi:hypothetical protein
VVVLGSHRGRRRFRTEPFHLLQEAQPLTQVKQKFWRQRTKDTARKSFQNPKRLFQQHQRETCFA